MLFLRCLLRNVFSIACLLDSTDTAQVPVAVLVCCFYTRVILPQIPEESNRFIQFVPLLKEFAKRYLTETGPFNVHVCLCFYSVEHQLGCLDEANHFFLQQKSQRTGLLERVFDMLLLNRVVETQTLLQWRKVMPSSKFISLR